MEGFFHDAHEVYIGKGVDRSWVATFRTRALAEWYLAASSEEYRKHGARVPEYEVVPV